MLRVEQSRPCSASISLWRMIAVQRGSVRRRLEQVDLVDAGNGGGIRHPCPEPVRALVKVSHLPVGVHAAGLARGPDRRSQRRRLVTGRGVVGRDRRDSLGLVLGAGELAVSSSARASSRCMALRSPGSRSS